MATLNIDVTNIDPTPRFDPIPAGDYTVIITASELKNTKDGTGQYLELREEIQGGEFGGRVIFDRLNLHNNNRQAVEIAQRQLSQICHAIGVLQVADSEQLHNRPLIAMVKVRPAREQFDASNEIKGYKAAAGAPVYQQPAAPRAPMQPAPQGSHAPQQSAAPARAAAPWTTR